VWKRPRLHIDLCVLKRLEWAEAESEQIGRLRPDRTVDRWTGSVTVRFRTFRKHRWPCGQPAAVGEIGRFRPEPPQAGHLVRMKATPSDFPFKSTGFATYPEPPQFGQSSGATPSPPRVSRILSQTGQCSAKVRFALRIPNKLPELIFYVVLTRFATIKMVSIERGEFTPSIRGESYPLSPPSFVDGCDARVRPAV